ncbi:WD40 repeat domain-containing protein [Rhizobium sp. FKY42]|uniref:WD40 repeat domain-containing protein n=1 Tax=Rhizobium sp. FKY42 TaxID=2562310 RepID=UPI0010C04611|nr:WD40 repeat domain-containing protein [Rhizobium sp. FKY42]
MMKHETPISGITSSQSYVATAGYDGRVLIWNKEITPISRGWHDHLVNHCDIAPDESSLASASSDGSVRLWKLPKLDLVGVSRAHKDDVMKVRFSPDGRYIASCSYDGSICIFNRELELLHQLSGHTSLIEDMVWSPDSGSLLSCGTDCRLILWDATKGMRAKEIGTGDADMDTAVFTEDDIVAVGNDNGELIFYNKVLEEQYRVKCHDSGIKCLTVNAHRTLLLSLGYDGKAKVWSLKGGKVKLTQNAEIPAIIWPRSASFLSDDEIAFATFGSHPGTWNLSQNVWDLSRVEPSVSLNGVYSDGSSIWAVGDAGVVRKDGAVIGEVGSLCNFVISSNGLTLTGGQTGHIYNVSTGDIIHSHTSPLNCATLVESVGSKYVCIGAYSGDVVVIELVGSTPTYVRTISANSNAIKGIDTVGTCVLTGCADGELVMVDPIGDKIVKRFPSIHNGILNNVTAVKEGTYASISRDLTLVLWNEGSEPEQFPSRHEHSIKSIASSGDGSYVCCGSYRGTIDIFDVAAKKWTNGYKKISATGISAITWHEPDNCFYASSYDGNIYAVKVA